MTDISTSIETAQSKAENLIDQARRVFAFPSQTMWLTSCALLLAIVVWVPSAGFAVTTKQIYLSVIVVVGLLAASWFYTIKRPEPGFQAALNGIAWISIFTPACAMLSYLLTAQALPMHDDLYSAIDKAMGFDWIAWLAWVNERPLFGNLLTATYHSSMVQVFVLIVVLSFTQRLAHLREFLALFAVTATTVIVFAGFFPSVGPYAYYQPAKEIFANLNPNAGAWHLEIFNALRAGTMETIDLSKVEGLVTFPSFHTALALITIYACRDMKYLFWPSLVLNALVILSTLSEGGHYLIDIFGGSFITLVAVLAYRRGATRPDDADKPHALQAPAASAS